MEEPTFEGTLSWDGQPADLPFDYDHYNRATTLEFAGGARIQASSPAVFRGDDSRANPETLLAALERRLLQGRLKESQGISLLKYLESESTLDDAVVANAIRLVMATPEFQLT